MPNDLRNEIEELTSRFAKDLLSAFQRAVMLGLNTAAEGSTSAPRRRGRPAGSKNASSSASVKKRGRRSKVDVEGLSGKVLGALRKAGKEGLRSEAIRTQLGIEKPAVVKVLSAMLVDKTIRKTGQKRATTYFAK